MKHSWIVTLTLLLCSSSIYLIDAQATKIKLIANYGSVYTYFDTFSAAFASIVPNLTAAEVFQFQILEGGVYSGALNTNINFNSFNNLTVVFFYAMPNQAVVIDCNGTGNGWTFQNFSNVHIGGDYNNGVGGFGNITFKRCRSALRVLNCKNFGITQTLISGNGRVNGSAITSINSSIVIGDQSTISSNTGYAVYFENKDTASHSLYIDGAVYLEGRTPVIFSGNEANIYSLGDTLFPSRCSINLLNTNLNGVDCCIGGTVTKGNTSTPLTCGCYSTTGMVTSGAITTVGGLTTMAVTTGTSEANNNSFANRIIGELSLFLVLLSIIVCVMY